MGGFVGNNFKSYALQKFYHTDPRRGKMGLWGTAAILNSTVSVAAIMGRSRSKVYVFVP